MISSKSAHLVERAAERLLQAGVLEGSAAQLLDPVREDLPATKNVPPSPAVATAATSPLPHPQGDTLIAELPAHEVEQAAAEVLRQDRPIIGLATLERAGLLDWTRGRSRISEEFRLAQRQLLHAAFAPAAQAGFSNLLMVTSARAGEGKSFAALNLACSVALQGDHPVLLIDSDAKRDSICQSLGLGEAVGLLDLAADPSADASDVILQTEIEHFSILPVGQERGRSSELFASREMTQLVQRLGRRYSDMLVILDAAPCLSTSDPAALAPIVGQILFVVEAERTQRDEVEAALDLIQTCPQIMMLLNKVQISTRYTFGAYSNYYSS
jgi:protein-tyrosine kinase